MQDDTKAIAERLTGKTRRIYERFKNKNEGFIETQNNIAKVWLFDPDNFDGIAKAITQFIFRDGPVEIVHRSCEDFSDEAMKEICIYTANCLFTLLTYARDGKWMEIMATVKYFSLYCNNWYPAEADTTAIDFLFYQQLKPKQ